MNKPLVIALSVTLCIALYGCGQQEQPAPTAKTDAPAATGQPAQPPRQAQRRNRLDATEIQQVQASGKTGLWSEPGEVCGTGPRQRGVLTWNVAASGASKVIVYIVDKAGKERNFGQGGAIGRRETGPWLRPGTIFKLRNAEGKAELASVTIGKKDC